MVNKVVNDYFVKYPQAKAIDKSGGSHTKQSQVAFRRFDTVVSGRVIKVMAKPTAGFQCSIMRTFEFKLFLNFSDSLWLHVFEQMEHFITFKRVVHLQKA